LILGSLILLWSNELEAQQYEIGLGLGGATYTGDIIRQIDPSQIGIQGTLFGRRNFDNAWSLRAGISVSRLNATDSVHPIDPMALARNAYFTGTVFEGTAVMEFHFLDYLSHQSINKYSPYGFLGLGYSVFSGDGQSYLGDPEAGKYSQGTPVVPFGLGIKYKLKDRLFLAMEFGFRATFTDNLDKIEDQESYLPRFIEDPTTSNEILNPQAFNYGNRNDRDWYYFLGVSLSYSFHQVKCYAY
jgi:hypothetical protein